MTARVCWVIPCYDEAERLAQDAFVALVDEDPEISLLFVNDGSRDATGTRLLAIAARRPERIRVLSLVSNQGKGEAVRLGLLDALSGGASFVGYFDADLATPIFEIRRLTQVMTSREIDVLFGARVALLGRNIYRTHVRHYAGRIFATAASIVVGLPVYDTQCGAKLFRSTPVLLRALREPFHSRWLFDVELLGRLVGKSGYAALDRCRVLEEPLREWRDVAGSKLRPRDFVQAAVDLARIAWALRRPPRG